MSNKITIEFSAEDRARLDKLQTTLEAIAESICTKLVFVGSDDGPAEQATAPQAAQESPAPTSNTAKTEKPAEASTAPQIMTGPQTEPTVKLADIQAKVVELSAKGLKAQVRDIVKAYADRVTALPEDKWPEVFEKLKALEG